MKLIERIEKSFDFWFLLFVSFVFFIFRLPSLFEPYWYGDEGIYQAVGIAMRNGALLYRDIWDNKPPLLYALYAIFNSDQMIIRLLSLIVGIFTVIAFYFLAKKLFQTKDRYSKPAFYATLIFTIFFSTPIIEGNIANAENFILLPMILCGIIVFSIVEGEKKDKHSRLLFAAGLLLGIAFLFKIVAVFDFFAAITFILIVEMKNVRQIFKKGFLISKIRFLSPFILSFFLPLFLVSIYFLINDSLHYFIRALLLSNISYVGYANKLLIPQGLLILKLILLMLSLLIVYMRKDKLDNTLIFILVWVIFSLFNTLFSQRPYNHYLLVFLPSLCLLIGSVIYNSKLRIYLSLVLVLSLFIILTNFTLGNKNWAYYKNFVDFVANKKSVGDYRNFFDGNTPVDYQLASYINLHSRGSDNIFIWGNNPQIYKLTNKQPLGKYTVAYHMTQYEDGLENARMSVDSKSPKYIILMSYQNGYPFSLSNYHEKVEIKGTIIYERNN